MASEGSELIARTDRLSHLLRCTYQCYSVLTWLCQMTRYLQMCAHQWLSSTCAYTHSVQSFCSPSEEDVIFTGTRTPSEDLCARQVEIPINAHVQRYTFMHCDQKWGKSKIEVFYLAIENRRYCFINEYSNGSVQLLFMHNDSIIFFLYNQDICRPQFYGEYCVHIIQVTPGLLNSCTCAASSYSEDSSSSPFSERATSLDFSWI